MSDRPVVPMCYGRFPGPGGGSITQPCPVQNTDKCPLYLRKFKQLVKEPCCYAIFIPNRFLTEANGDSKKAARNYVEECLSD